MSNAALHQFGRATLLAAWPGVTGEQPTISELEISGAIADKESGYGTATFHNIPAGTSISNTGNWGSVISGDKPPCPPGTFEATDSMPSLITADNPHGQYNTCFVEPATPVLGAAAFIKQLTIRRPDTWAAMKAGDIDATTLAMSQRHGSVGAYFQANPVTYAASLVPIVAEIAAAMGEPIEAVRGGPYSGGGGGGSGITLGEGVLGLGFAVAAGVLLRRAVERNRRS